jgi:hypothetical protein
MTHKDLDVYKLSLELVEDIYKLTKSFPTSENFGLTSQLRRAAVSLPSNIAEGSSRASTKTFYSVFKYNYWIIIRNRNTIGNCRAHRLYCF